MGQPELPHADDHTLISTSRVKGTDVYDSDGTHIGRVTDVMIERKTGKVAYLILSSGGLFGIGGQVQPLPWSTVSYDPAIQGYRHLMASEHIRNAPSFAPEALAADRTEPMPDLSDVEKFYDSAEAEGRMKKRERSAFTGAQLEERVLGGLGGPAGTSGGISGTSGIGRSGY